MCTVHTDKRRMNEINLHRLRSAAWQPGYRLSIAELRNYGTELQKAYYGIRINYVKDTKRHAVSGGQISILFVIIGVTGL